MIVIRYAKSFSKEGDAMKRRAFTIVIILLAALLLLAWCGKHYKDAQNETQSAIAVYYISQSGTDLVANSIKLPDTSRKGQVRYLIEQLITPPVGKISPLSDGTTLNSVTIRDDIAVIDFSEEFSKKDDLKQTLAPVAVAKTLCSLDFISGVQILVDGQEAIGTDGKPLGIIYESDLVINKGEPTQAPKTTLVLYFSDENAEYLVAERRNIEIASGDTIEKAVVNELIKGPTEAGRAKTIPQETKLLSIETKNNVCFVNLSKEFVDKHPGGSTGERLTIYSIVNSLTELGTIDKVQFLIEGEKREEYIHMVLNEPIVRNKTIIR